MIFTYEMNEQKLLKALEEHIVLIKVQSLKSGKEYQREYTLHPKWSNSVTISGQKGDKIVCYDVEFRKWEDLEVDTIVEWKIVE